MKVYEDNTAAKYTTKIPSTIDLSGDWEVALSEIIYPARMLHTVDGNECSIRIFITGAPTTDITLACKVYDNPTTLMKDLIALKGSYFRIIYDEKTGAVEMKCDNRFAAIAFSKTLARFLGFKQPALEFGKDYRGVVCMGINPSTMYVYCDPIEHVIVGDVRAPLLRTFGMEKSSNDVVHRNFPNLVYVPIQKKQFDTIDINIMTDTGEPMPFASGKSTVLLHFRRSSNPYFLLQR